MSYRCPYCASIHTGNCAEYEAIRRAENRADANRLAARMNAPAKRGCLPVLIFVAAVSILGACEHNQPTKAPAPAATLCPHAHAPAYCTPAVTP